MPEESRYSVAEISLATGMTKSLIASRRKCYGIPANRNGYTEAEIMKMLHKPPQRRGPNRQRAERLRANLKNNGYLK